MVLRYLRQLKVGGIVEDQLVRLKREGMPPLDQIFWYIDYQHVVDVIKYKLVSIKETLEIEGKEVNGDFFLCPNESCKATYSELDADRLDDEEMNDFTCLKCRTVLKTRDTSKGKDNAKLIRDMQPLFDLVRLADDIDIPKYYHNTDHLELVQGANGSGGGGGGGGGGKRLRVNDLYTPQSQLSFSVVIDDAATDSRVPSMDDVASLAMPRVKEEGQQKVGMRPDAPEDDVDVKPAAAVATDNAIFDEFMQLQKAKGVPGTSIVKPEPGSMVPPVKTEPGRTAASASLPAASADAASLPAAPAAADAPEEQDAAAAEDDADAAAAEDEDAAMDDADEVTVLAGGVEYPLSSVTEEVMEKMTDEEYAIYSAHVESMDEGAAFTL